jgi:site-specific DNA-methyltransferase (adenine-specific)
VLDPDGSASHPSQKPIAIMQPFVELVDEGETVLDCFAGTGTTGVACLRAGRKFIGIEKDPKHFETMCRRIEAEWSAPRLNYAAPVKPVQDALL